MKVKTVFQIFLLTLGLSLLISCTSNTNKNRITGTINEVNLSVESNKKVNKIEEDIIFSTKDLETAKIYLPDEYPLKVITENGTIETNSDYIIQLTDYNKFKVVICEIDGGDSFINYLYVVKSGSIISDKYLELSPYWSEQEDDGDYRKIHFEISSDYLIRIDTEEKTEGEIKKYTNNYRINENGDFYEVKE